MNEPYFCGMLSHRLTSWISQKYNRFIVILRKTLLWIFGKWSSSVIGRIKVNAKVDPGLWSSEICHVLLQDNEPRIKLQCTSNVFVGSKRPCPIRGIAPSRGRSRFQIFQADDIISKKQNNNRLDTIRYSKSEKLKVK